MAPGLLLLLIAAGYNTVLEVRAGSTVTRGNVVFDRVKEVSISHTSWKVTYVVDLGIYDDLFEESFQHLGTVAAEVWRIIEANQNETKDHEGPLNFGPQYNMLYRRLQQVNGTKDRLLATLEEYKSLRPRSERALLPFIGSIYNFLFGVETESSLNDIRSSINDLADNQQKIKHVVNQSLTIISTTYETVKENRKKINGIITQLTSLKSSLEIFAGNTNKVTKSILSFLTSYSQLNTIIEDMEELAIEALKHIDDLRAQLDMLALGRLTPSVVGPLHLREILREVAKKLPSNLFMPINPKNHIWEFYKRISCTSVFDTKHVLIVLDIPLGSYQDKYDLIRVFNMPLPNVEMYGSVTNSKVYNPRQMIAQYDLEVDTFAMERARGKYVLLTPDEASKCLENESGFCQFNSPVYSVGPDPRACVIALFLNNEAKARKVCRVMVKPNHILPQARNIAEGSWIVSTLHPFTFTITCRPRSALKRGKSYPMKIRPPLQSLTLPPNCAANSEFITLPPYYDLKSVARFKPDIENLFVNKTYDLWQPLYKSLPTFNTSWDLTPLEDVEELNMDELIKTLDDVKKVHVKLKPEGWGWKEWLFTGAAVIVGLLVLSWIIKSRTNGFTYLSSFLSRPSFGRHPHEEPEPEAVPLKPLQIVASAPPPDTPNQPQFIVPPVTFKNTQFNDKESEPAFRLRLVNKELEPGHKSSALNDKESLNNQEPEPGYQSHPLEVLGDNVKVTEIKSEKPSSNFNIYPVIRKP